MQIARTGRHGPGTVGQGRHGPGIVRALRAMRPSAAASCRWANRLVSTHATKTNMDTGSKYVPSSARDAVEAAIKMQTDTEGGRTQEAIQEAIRLYALAMTMSPSDDEARSAMYNMGCALVKQKQWERAAECVVTAINRYQLRLSVALEDNDLRELRERREWVDALMEVKGGLSRNAKIDMRAEAKAPFRLPRLVLFSSLGIGAFTGLFIISARLIAAIKGGEGAPDLQESVQNFAINSTAVVLLGWLVDRDLQSKQKVVRVTEREEVLGRLQIELGGTRQLPLLRFRGQIRPVIISGSRDFVEKAVRAANPFYEKLRARGVSVVPVIVDEVENAKKAITEDPDAKIRALKKELQSQRPEGKGFGNKDAAEAPTSSSVAPPEPGLGVQETDKKWRLVPYQVVEWKEWVDGQKEFAGLQKGAKDAVNTYVQVQLDGTVRTSGRGMPDWAKFVDDLPPLDSVRTTMMDGIGSDV
eukprot:CAMPEP_0119113798 /NCGR_PEP_ID=MMETSP1180-20130426/45215_1 /TAXON_ID=3052 ORGANISM="Chlamydomonas cf sp, Strain CCMP681" /NCGR_SAMPLE_ID=MMETSP1180 /ASSEMBLY_ACC=CAM_ASM_000741 /LENGTH=471 /DNA_ID=CAMNT_0007102049 /DNA_START=9 /DNA_END=1424 /DNA_ORIENTATION=-